MKQFFTFLIATILSIICLQLNAQDVPATPTLIGTGVFKGETAPLRDLPAISPEQYQIMKEKWDGLIDAGDMIMLDNNASVFVAKVTP
jgi:hypothetical protein